MVEVIKKIPTFEQIPMLMAHLIDDNSVLKAKVDALTNAIRLSNSSSTKGDDDERMDVSEAQEYIPGHPRPQTIYGWTSNGQIPYHKIGKRIYFVKSELDEWLSHGKQKSADELSNEAENYVNHRKKHH